MQTPTLIGDTIPLPDPIPIPHPETLASPLTKQ